MGQHKLKVYQQKRGGAKLKLATPTTGYSSPHHLIEKKEVPPSFEALVRELQLPQNHDLAKRAEAAGPTFELCLGQLAADLDIVLDGAYTPEDLEKLFGILVERLRQRTGPLNKLPHLVDARLVNVELVETKQEIILEEVGRELKTVGAKAGDGPYTICDRCTTAFECCTNRACALGKPAVQLGKTVPESVKLLSALVARGEIKPN